MGTSPNTRRFHDLQASDDIGRTVSTKVTRGDVIAARYDRRDIVHGAPGVAAIAASASPLALMGANPAQAAGGRVA
ncbi:hypothetical protein [Tepidamorphus gemmatus]|nr:hypothetical protein [Tepidamorphus gemmatus]